VFPKLWWHCHWCHVFDSLKNANNFLKACFVLFWEHEWNSKKVNISFYSKPHEGTGWFGSILSFQALVHELISGSALAMEIRGENIVTKFREFCGPHSPEIAKALFPKSIRSLFGKNRIQNAVHCMLNKFANSTHLQTDK
jgi:nucleoside diphosphate kinase